jgi:hypothetical protein
MWGSDVRRLNKKSIKKKPKNVSNLQPYNFPRRKKYNDEPGAIGD